ncbi:MAG: hypothetical protein ACR2K5_01650 [Pseudolabrys sp.]
MIVPISVSKILLPLHRDAYAIDLKALASVIVMVAEVIGYVMRLRRAGGR